MTDAQQPEQEYVLTEDTEIIRSKTMNCKGCGSNTCAEICQNWQRQHDAAIAKAERERVLDELVQMIKDNDMDKSDSPYFIHTSTINGFIKSLRQEARRC